MRLSDAQTFPPEFRGVQGQHLAFHSLQHRRRKTPNEVAGKKKPQTTSSVSAQTSDDVQFNRRTYNGLVSHYSGY
jgi:hypothetical protein